MKRPDFFSLDLETHKIQPGLLTPPIVIGSFADEHGGFGLLTPVQAIEQLRLGAKAGWVVAGANIAYDFGCIIARDPSMFPVIWEMYEQERVYDVSIAATLNAIAEGRLTDGDLWRRDGTKVQKGRYSLEEVVLEWLGRSDAKGNDRWRQSYALLEGIPVEQWPADARQYPVDDAVNTLEAALVQVGTPALNLHNLPAQAHAAFCMHLGAIWGLRTDGVAVDTLRARVEEALAALRATAQEHGLVRPDGTKDMAAIQALVSKAYNGNPPLTPSGKPATDRDTLEDSGNELLVEWSGASKWQKIRDYLPSLEIAAKVPLNVRSNPVLATGRSSYEGIIQLMPQEGGVRECCVPRPGRLYSSVDYAAIEMSTFAQVCLWTVGWSNLAEEINKGRDPHSILGGDLLGISYESFLKDAKGKFKNIRQAAKAGNFGYPGMMGAVKFVIAKLKAGQSVCEWLHQDGHCGGVKERVEYQEKGKKVVKFLCTRCIEVSGHIREKYLTRWAEVKPYWTWVTAELEGHNETVTQFVSKRLRGGLSAPAAANTLFQGLAADGAKRAVVALTKEMYLDSASPLYGSRLVVFSHDETILEVPEEKAHEASLRQAEVMVKCMSEVVPDVRVKAEPALMRRWYKKADAVYNNGKLIPWEPK